MQTNYNEEKYLMKTVQKAIHVLRAFSIEEKRLSLTEINKKTKIGNSSLQRILYTLCKEGLLQKSEEDKRYQLSMDFVFFSELVKRSSNLISVAEPIIQDINSSTTENVSVSILENNKRKCIASTGTKHELAALTYVGQLSPLYAGASAKVFLAYFSETYLEKYLNELTLEPITENTIISKKVLIEELNKIKEKGYAISYEERVKGAVSISSPIFDPLMNIIATLTILIPTVRIDDYNIESLISSIVSGSNEITEKLNVTNKSI